MIRADDDLDDDPDEDDEDFDEDDDAEEEDEEDEEDEDVETWQVSEAILCSKGLLKAGLCLTSATETA